MFFILSIDLSRLRVFFMLSPLAHRSWESSRRLQLDPNGSLWCLFGWDCLGGRVGFARVFAVCLVWLVGLSVLAAGFPSSPLVWGARFAEVSSG